MSLPEIPPGSDVWGIDSRVVHELGRVVATAGMLEGVGVAIGRLCGVDQPERQSFGDLMKRTRKSTSAAIQRAADQSLDDDLRRWTRDAEALMEERNSELHAVRFQIAGADGWIPHQQQIRWGTRKQQDLDELRDLRSRLRAAWDAGFELHQRLDSTGTSSPIY